MTSILILRPIEALTLWFHLKRVSLYIYLSVVAFYYFAAQSNVPLLIIFILWRFYAFKLVVEKKNPSVNKSVSSIEMFVPYLFSVTLLHDFVMVGPLVVDT